MPPACRSTSAAAPCKKQSEQQLEDGPRTASPQMIHAHALLPGPAPVAPPAGSVFTAGSAVTADGRPVPAAGPAAPAPREALLPGGGGTGGLMSAELSPAAAASATAAGGCCRAVLLSARLCFHGSGAIGGRLHHSHSLFWLSRPSALPGLAYTATCVQGPACNAPRGLLAQEGNVQILHCHP